MSGSDLCRVSIGDDFMYFFSKFFIEKQYQSGAICVDAYGGHLDLDFDVCSHARAPSK